ncbi:MAG TPA: molecular chaperone TorD family protein [Gemmataceae bacterium]|nr:molecular chaperone TorD family protein [Gemmataceae bacterium]
MTTMQLAPEASAADLARECVYRFLSVALSDPWAEAWGLLYDPKNQRLAREAADLLRAEAERSRLAERGGASASPCEATPLQLGFGELPPDKLDFARLLAELPPTQDALRDEYDHVFGLVLSRECPPYETEYLPNEETFFRSQQLADISGFYRAFGVGPSHSRPERPDHLALELEFMAFVLTKKRLAFGPEGDGAEAVEQAAVCDDAQAKFFRDHLAWWLPSFAAALRRKAGSGFYAAVAEVLAALLPLERARFGVLPPRLPLQPALIERPEEQSGCAGCT